MTKAKQNRKKYLKSPDLKMVRDFIKELDVNEAQFERFYGIPRKTVSQMSIDGRDLPAKFWHIIYEKVKPAYGVGFLEPVESIFNRNKNKIKPSLKNTLVSTNKSTKEVQDIDIKGRLADLM